MVIAGTSVGHRLPAVEERAGTVEFLDASQPPERKRWFEVWSGWPRREVERRRDWERGQGREWSPAADFFPAYRA